MINDLIYRLRKRAEIRRSIDTRKSVQNNEPDRIANLLEEAADRIAELEKQYATLQTQFDNLYEYANNGDEKQSEPIAWTNQQELKKYDPKIMSKVQSIHFPIPLYTTPQTKPLSDEEIKEVWSKIKWNGNDPIELTFARAIEAKVRGDT